MRTHGMSKGRFYRIYRGIKNRCNLPSDNNYHCYGGRGIKCEWNTFNDFYYTMYKSYIEHVEKYGEKDTTIERIDVNGNYCVENCRRATIKEQGNNTRFNLKIEHDGVKYPSLRVLCESLNLNYNTVYKRVYLEGQDVNEAIRELQTKANKYKYKGVTYKGITDLCRKLGLKRTSIAYRIKMGMSIEDAIESEFRTYNKSIWKTD